MRTKEDILDNSSIIYELETPNNYHNINYIRGMILECMEEYHKEQMRSDLMKFFQYLKVNNTIASDFENVSHMFRMADNFICSITPNQEK